MVLSLRVIGNVGTLTHMYFIEFLSITKPQREAGDVFSCSVLERRFEYSYRFLCLTEFANGNRETAFCGAG